MANPNPNLANFKAEYKLVAETTKLYAAFAQSKRVGSRGGRSAYEFR
jgi:hypothetical protein